MGFSTYTEALGAPEAGLRCDERLVMHHVANGGCLKDFHKAMKECHPGPSEYEDQQRRGRRRRRGVAKPVVIVDVESTAACVKATAALRKCFAGNPATFEHQYLQRIDEGLDQDVKLSPNDIWMDERTIFRWWTGMRRSL